MRHALRLKHWWGLGLFCALGVVVGPKCGAAADFPDALLFDGSSKELNVEAGATNAIFAFAFTNAAPGQVVIESVRTSCGCTVAKVPTLPWVIPPGGDGEFSVTLDLRGKRGTVTKSVFVNTSMGTKPLTVRAVIPDNGSGGGAGGGMDDRLRNMQIALADRTAIFRGDCASCHATPASSKQGPALYLAACAICHDSHNRASMVPDLKNLSHPTDRDHWIRWINFGRHGSLMPAFSKSEGGILSDNQIDSLADYLTRTISDRRLAGARPANAAAPRAPTGPIQYPPLPGGVSSPGGARP